MTVNFSLPVAIRGYTANDGGRGTKVVKVTQHHGGKPLIRESGDAKTWRSSIKSNCSLFGGV
ncbi:MAG: hypothetical protein WCR72_02940 [Bacteroidota bacterium]